ASAHLEANLIGYAGDLYGASVSLAFTRWLRPSRVFDSLDELIATVEGNIDDIRHHLGEQGVSIRD
ncbi:MAG: riboflavin kinase, partial [Collinsella sp.]